MHCWGYQVQCNTTIYHTYWVSQKKLSSSLLLQQATGLLFLVHPVCAHQICSTEYYNCCLLLYYHSLHKYVVTRFALIVICGKQLNSNVVVVGSYLPWYVYEVKMTQFHILFQCFINSKVTVNIEYTAIKLFLMSKTLLLSKSWD